MTTTPLHACASLSVSEIRYLQCCNGCESPTRHGQTSRLSGDSSNGTFQAASLVSSLASVCKLRNEGLRISSNQSLSLKKNGIWSSCLLPGKVTLVSKAFPNGQFLITTSRQVKFEATDKNNGGLLFVVYIYCLSL